MSVKKLEKKIHKQISEICTKGNELVKEAHYSKAIKKYQEAWELLPGDKSIWDAGLWILMEIGEIYLLDEKYEMALNSYQEAMVRYGPLGYVFVHNRLR